MCASPAPKVLANAEARDMNYKIAVDHNGMTCPECGKPELNPNTNRLNIRAYKVLSEGHWWSHCLRCDHWF
jgi:hypothetical protein